MGGLLELIFPKRCAGCGRFGSYFCRECIGAIYQADLVCPDCDKPAIGGACHPLCHKRYGLDGLWSLGIYQNPLKLAIKKLKYRLVRDFAEVLVDLMIEYWARFQPLFFKELKNQGQNWLVVPVPLHPKRQKWRGFNQSALLGRILAEKLGLKYQETLKRVRYTKPQAELKGWERKKNIRNAFALDSNNKLAASNCLLIDDVWTTGSTLKECCSVLKRAGAKKIWAITLAR
jgi:competence protein ComFC